LEREEPYQKIKRNEPNKVLVFSVIRNPNSPYLTDIDIVEGEVKGGKIKFNVPENYKKVSYKLGLHKTRWLTYKRPNMLQA
jgi:hypothetical protein